MVQTLDISERKTPLKPQLTSQLLGSIFLDTVIFLEVKLKQKERKNNNFTRDLITWSGQRHEQKLNSIILMCFQFTCYMNHLQKQLSPAQHVLTTHEQLHAGVTLWDDRKDTSESELLQMSNICTLCEQLLFLKRYLRS